MSLKDKNQVLSIYKKVAHNWLYTEEANSERQYLFSRLSKELIDKYEIGFTPRKENLFIEFIDEVEREINKNRNYDNAINHIDILADLELLYITPMNRKIKPHFKYHNILIPIHDVYSNTVGFVARSVLSRQQLDDLKIDKYKYSKFQKRNHLFGLNFNYKNILKKDKVIITEGQIDQIKGSTISDIIIATGSNKITFEQIALLRRYTNNFIIAYDNDDGGEKGFAKVKSYSKKYEFNISKLEIPKQYKDFDEFVSNEYNINLEGSIIDA